MVCCAGLVPQLAGEVMAAEPSADAKPFPRGLESYDDADVDSIWTILVNRVEREPFNLIATLIFFLAIIHTFMTARFMTISHRWEHEHQKKIDNGEAGRDSVHHGARLFHFLGEVEAVFGIWAVALVIAIIGFYDWNTVVNYVGHHVNFTEPAFVVVVMTLAATRPILRLSENLIKRIAKLFGGSLTALWLATLFIGPVLGSFITEPAAMTISALVLARNFYELGPSLRFKYGYPDPLRCPSGVDGSGHVEMDHVAYADPLRLESRTGHSHIERTLLHGVPPGVGEAGVEVRTGESQRRDSGKVSPTSANGRDIRPNSNHGQ
jgi:hypothetical protein